MKSLHHCRLWKFLKLKLAGLFFLCFGWLVGLMWLVLDGLATDWPGKRKFRKRIHEIIPSPSSTVEVSQIRTLLVCFIFVFG